MEAVEASLEKLQMIGFRVNVIHGGVGAVTGTDVFWQMFQMQYHRVQCKTGRKRYKCLLKMPCGHKAIQRYLQSIEISRPQ